MSMNKVSTGLSYVAGLCWLWLMDFWDAVITSISDVVSSILSTCEPAIEAVQSWVLKYLGIDFTEYKYDIEDPNLWSAAVVTLLVVLIIRSCARQGTGFWHRDERLSGAAQNGEYDSGYTELLNDGENRIRASRTTFKRNRSFPTVMMPFNDDSDTRDSDPDRPHDHRIASEYDRESGSETDLSDSDDGLTFSSLKERFNRDHWMQFASNVLPKNVLLRKKKNSAKGGPRLRVREAPASFLEAGWEDTDDHNNTLQSEVLVILKTCRVFGYFESPVVLELVKHVATISLYKGENLFKIGDADDSIYVVSSGEIQVVAKDKETEQYTVMDVVQPGGSVSSLVSILEVMAGHTSQFVSVEARAITPATVLRVPMAQAKPIFDRFPSASTKMASMILVRLQRVTLLILYNYLGLTHELFLPIDPVHKNPTTRVRAVGKTFTKLGPTKDVLGFGMFTRGKSGGRVSRHGSNTSDTQAQTVMRSMNSAPRLEDLKEGQTVAQLIEEGVEALCQQFKLNKELVHKLVEHDIIEGNTVLVEQGQPHLDCHLYHVISGTIEASLTPTTSQRYQGSSEGTRLEHVVMVAHPGETIGEMSLVTSMPSFYTLSTGDKPVRMLKLSVQSFEILMNDSPPSMLLFALHGVSRVSPLVRKCDFGVDWSQVEAGKLVYKQGSEAVALYIVLNGRVRSVVTSRQGGRKTLVTEFGRGESVGEIELLTATPRATSVHAIRDTELAKLPGELFEMIRQKYPKVSNAFTRKLGERLLGAMELPRGGPTAPLYQQEEERMSTNKNLSTVAVVAVSNDVPLHQFCARLTAALSTIGSCLHLTRNRVEEMMGDEVFSTVHEYKLISWLGEQEEHHNIVLYETDKKSSAWTKRCVRQADCILIVGLGDNEPTVGAVERDLESITNRAQKELVLLHSFRKKPTRTVEWLNLRDWCTAHHHIRCARAFLHGYQAASTTPPNIHSDFSRLARRLTNTSVGLVLGGGGARGLSHIGILHALQESNIPIDMVGGTSIGALIGGLYSEVTEWERVWERAQVWSFAMASLWAKIMDLTYPITAIFNGSSFNTSIHDLFQEQLIEDLWLPYFCITTDLTDSKMKIHRHGTLWRYVRSSMTLAGYLPPLCDPEDGHLLVDGGYTNNLPADIMRDMGAQSIIAVDVSSKDEKDLTNYGDSLSGWWLLWKRWNPFATPIKVPDMAEIQSRLAYVSCVRQFESVADKNYINLVRPPIDVYSTLQFGAFHEIVDVGYNHATNIINGHNWKQIHPDADDPTEDSHTTKSPIPGMQTVSTHAQLRQTARKVIKS